MSNKANGNNKVFTHAFLPGLILGLILGGVAGAMLPDLLNSPKIPIHNATGNPATGGHDRDSRENEMMNDTDVDDAIEDAAEQAEENLPDSTPGDG